LTKRRKNNMGSETQKISLELEKALSSADAKTEVSSERLIGIRVPQDKVPQALAILLENGITQLSTITGLDIGDRIEIDYHFWLGNKIITLKTSVSKSDPRLQTSIAVIPGAILYEMEVHDMFGVVFEGHPWMDRRLLLPDNYPKDLPPPLLKSTSSQRIRKAVGIEK
jgi:NADH:ubiquinone oxidoreductase subunit C